MEACELLGELYHRVHDRGVKDRVNVWSAVMRSTVADHDPIRRARAAVEAADALVHDNQLVDAKGYLEEAERLLPPDHPLWSGVEGVRAFMFILDSRFREALAAARRAVDIANRGGTMLERSRAHSILAHPAILPLMGEAGRETMRAWLAEAEASGDERLIIDGRHFILSDTWTRGIVDETQLRQAEEGVRKAGEMGWTLDEASLRMVLGWGYFLTGRWLEAGSHLGRANTLVESQGGRIRGMFHLLLPYFRGNLAMGYGRIDEARRIFEGGLAHARFHDLIWLNHDLGRCHQMRGDLAAAEGAMAEAQAARDRFRCIVCGCQADGVTAEFYAAVGDGAQAALLMARAAETAEEIGHVATLIRVRRAKARVALARGAVGEAVEAAHGAVALGEGLPLPQVLEQGQSLLLLGQAQAAAGDGDAARTSWEEARNRFSALGASWFLRQVEETQGAASARMSSGTGGGG